MDLLIIYLILLFVLIYFINYRRSYFGKSIEFSNKYSILLQKLRPSKLGKLLLSQNLTFYGCDSVNKTEGRLLVVIFAWLFAKDRHLEKYRTLYFEKNFDVLTVKIGILDFLIPSWGSHVIAQKIINFLRELDSEYQTIMFQAFSIGAYQMGEVFVHLKRRKNQSVLNRTKQSLKGIVYDSAVDVNEAPIGISKASTNYYFLQKLISIGLYIHLRLSYQFATKHYIRSSNSIQNNFLRCPVLVLFSRNDEVANHVNTLKVIEKVESSGILVFQKCWENSQHVSHYYKYPKEYQALIEEFLKNINAI